MATIHFINFGGSSAKVAASATPIAESKLFARESLRIAISASFIETVCRHESVFI